MYRKTEETSEKLSSYINLFAKWFSTQTLCTFCHILTINNFLYMVESHFLLSTVWITEGLKNKIMRKLMSIVLFLHGTELWVSDFLIILCLVGPLGRLAVDSKKWRSVMSIYILTTFNYIHTIHKVPILVISILW